MTRINCVPVDLLTDQQLMGEYREMPRMSSYLKKSYATGRPLSIPLFYKMSTGHVKFFYDKGQYLKRRFDELKQELRNRGMSPQVEWSLSIFKHYGLMGDWEPDRDAVQVNVERICERIDEIENPKYYGRLISHEDAKRMLMEYAKSYE